MSIRPNLTAHCVGVFIGIYAYWAVRGAEPAHALSYRYADRSDPHRFRNMTLALRLASLATGRSTNAIYDRVNCRIAGIPARNERGFYICPPYVEDLDYWNILAVLGEPRRRRRSITDKVARFLGA